MENGAQLEDQVRVCRAERQRPVALNSVVAVVGGEGCGLGRRTKGHCHGSARGAIR
jgi:hypothetical protein